jgi:hypothetical protein
LCNEKCDTLYNLQGEFLLQVPNFPDLKTLLFVFGDELDSKSCGWAKYASNLALIHDFANARGGCNWPTSKVTTGLSGPSGAIIHELIHTFGIHHVCNDKTDLMIGTPECTIDEDTYEEAQITLDVKGKQYVGSEAAFGTDILRLPIWSDGSGASNYSQIKQNSNLKYIPQLDDDTVYAVIGQETKKFDWSWEKELNPKTHAINCTLISGATRIQGKVNESACTFQIPINLRAGAAFTVSQSWNMGPWFGTASVTGVLVRADLTSTPCTVSICFVGGSTLSPNSCWSSGVKNLVLQQLVNGKWKVLASLKSQRDKACDRKEFPFTANYKLNFKQKGTFIYRWVVPKRPGWNATYDTPFAIIVNDPSQPEPSQVEIDAAQATAIKLGKLAK